MSAASYLLTEEQLLCGICLDVFSVPVTLPCGHNFCKTCIMRHWDTSIQCACPSCKYPFYRKLDLRVNTFISEMAAQFRRTAGRPAAHQEVAKPGEVPCDVCIESKKRAVKSCLVCLASYCESHLEPHLSAARLKRHQLTEPLDNLEGRMCAIHDKPLELFCRTDQTCVCMLCPVLDHKSHEVVPLKEQFERRKSELGKTQAQIHRMIQERRAKIQEITHLVKRSRDSAEREAADGVQVLSLLIRSLERVQAEFTETIKEMQDATETQAKDYIQQLEREISELLRKRAEVEHLSRSKDNLHFLQTVTSLDAPGQTKDWSEVRPDAPPFDGMARTMLDQLEETLSRDAKKLLRQAEAERVRRSRVEVTLDPDTAHPALVLSDDGKRVHHSAKRKNLPDNSERFNPSCCVLGSQSFSSGRFYYEVEVKDKTRWTVGVAKHSIRRKGVIPLCPDNGHWTIWLKNGDEYAALVTSPLPLSPASRVQKVGVFVDYEDGLVSFYDADAADLLYSFTGCAFAEKLRPFFSPGLNDDGANAAPLVISPVSGSDGRDESEEEAPLKS